MNAYHKWLGITEAQPDHYRLLGIDRFESDPEVISNAADRQMVYLRTLRNPEAEEILNEVAAARICLLDPVLNLPQPCELDPILAEVVEEPEGHRPQYELAGPHQPISFWRVLAAVLLIAAIAGAIWLNVWLLCSIRAG